MDYRIVFHPRAVRELDELADFIAEQAGPDRALEFVGRIKAYCLGFANGDRPRRSKFVAR